jgi:hypothetical protein
MSSEFSTVLFLAFMLTATSSWAMDADDQDDAAKDAPAKTQDADAKPDQAAAPPGHAYTHSGQPAAKPPAKGNAASMAKAATDPSAILTQWGMFGWTDIASTYDFKNNRSTVSLGARFGKVFMAKHPLNVAVTPYYKINNKGRDNVWGLKLQMTLVTPELFRH